VCPVPGTASFVLGALLLVAPSGQARATESPSNGHAALPVRQRPDAALDPILPSLLEFVTWAHPTGPACAPPGGIQVIERWPGGLRAAYDITCGKATQRLESVFVTREGKGVWQVAEGFESEPGQLSAALETEGIHPPGGVGAAAGKAERQAEIAPPPANPGSRRTGTPIDVVVPPVAVRENHAEYPEEAGRARLLGEAHVELLVDISPGGVPIQARPLRGPDPDLGMRRAAIEAVLRWRFQPALLAGKAVRYFSPVEITFEGLAPGMTGWVHRALFHIEAIVSPDPGRLEEAQRRLAAGEPFAVVAAALASGETQGGDRGFVPASSLPAPVRKALHDAPVGGTVGPVPAGGRIYLMRKRGEIYYALHAAPGEEVTYKVLHERNAPEGEALRQALESDIHDFLAESRRRAYRNEAARLMGIRQTRVAIGQLLIHTDVLDEQEVRMLGRVVEATILAHQEFWSPIVSLRPFSDQILVYAFARQSDHDRLHRLWQEAGGPAPAGEYIPASRLLAIPCEGTDGHLPVPILIHEAIHMLDFERVYGAGERPSPWFEEGLANYFGFSHVDSQLRIEPGEIRRSGTIVTGGVRLQFDPRTQLYDHLRRSREKGAVPLEELLLAGPAEALWTSDRPARGYGAAWTLVQFLRHGEKGRYRTAFSEYARLEAGGHGAREAFARLFGPDLKALEGAWHAYEAGL
jgi:TonB family protein